jgi:hypothetical protein
MPQACAAFRRESGTVGAIQRVTGPTVAVAVKSGAGVLDLVGYVVGMGAGDAQAASSALRTNSSQRFFTETDYSLPATQGKILGKEGGALLGCHGARTCVIFQLGSEQLRADVATIIEHVPINKLAAGWRTGVTHLVEE